VGAQQREDPDHRGEENELLPEGVDPPVVEGGDADRVGRLPLGYRAASDDPPVAALVVAEVGKAGEAPDHQRRKPRRGYGEND
jgi:hypothetical protein